MAQSAPRTGRARAGRGWRRRLYRFLPEAMRARLDTSIRFPWLHLAPDEAE